MTAMALPPCADCGVESTDHCDACDKYLCASCKDDHAGHRTTMTRAEAIALGEAAYQDTLRSNPGGRYIADSARAVAFGAVWDAAMKARVVLPDVPRAFIVGSEMYNICVEVQADHPYAHEQWRACEAYRRYAQSRLDAQGGSDDQR